MIGLGIVGSPSISFNNSNSYSSVSSVEGTKVGWMLKILFKKLLPGGKD